MRIIFTFYVLVLLLSGCETSTQSPKYAAGQGVEIYLAKYINSFNYTLDYTKINLDTIQLQENPLIPYNYIKTYNPQNHIVELNITVDNIKGFKPRVNGHMFVITVDKERIYCGFFRPSISSAMFNWIIIDEAIDSKSKTLPIYFIHDEPEKDPRADDRIIARLSKDGKLK